MLEFSFVSSLFRVMKNEQNEQVTEIFASAIRGITLIRDHVIRVPFYVRSYVLFFFFPVSSLQNVLCQQRMLRGLLQHKGGGCELTCVPAVSFPFLCWEIDQANEQAGEQRSTPRVNKNCEESGRGWARRGRWWGEKESPHFTPSPCPLFFAFARSFVPFTCFSENAH